jgi:hypothetical protein
MTATLMVPPVRKDVASTSEIISSPERIPIPPQVHEDFTSLVIKTSKSNLISDFLIQAPPVLEPSTQLFRGIVDLSFFNLSFFLNYTTVDLKVSELDNIFSLYFTLVRNDCALATEVNKIQEVLISKILSNQGLYTCSISQAKGQKLLILGECAVNANFVKAELGQRLVIS